MTPPLLAASLADWGQFLAGAAAMLVVIAPFMVKVIERRNKVHLMEALDATFFNQIKEVLIQRAERAGPHRTRVIDIKFMVPEALIRLPVILDQWLTVLPGCEIMGDQFASDKTTYFLRCDNTARIRRHTHDGAESVLVIKGCMRDLATGKLYAEGQTWDIPAGQVHSVVFEAPEDNSSHGLFLVTVTPPLPTSAQVLLQLDGLARLAG